MTLEGENEWPQIKHVTSITMHICWHQQYVVKWQMVPIWLEHLYVIRLIFGHLVRLPASTEQETSHSNVQIHHSSTEVASGYEKRQKSEEVEHVEALRRVRSLTHCQCRICSNVDPSDDTVTASLTFNFRSKLRRIKTGSYFSHKMTFSDTAKALSSPDHLKHV